VSPFTNFQQRFIHSSVARRDAPEVPDFSGYRANTDSNRALSYFMVGSMGIISASAAKSSVSEFLQSMAASADVLALAKVEVDLTTIPEGKNAIIKWRGKPVFIRHRTSEEVDEARTVDWKSLRDPQHDDTRVKKPEWLVMLGVCTHLGCVPIGEAGDFGGWCVLWCLCIAIVHSCCLFFIGSAHAMVHTTIYVRFPISLGVIRYPNFPLQLAVFARGLLLSAFPLPFIIIASC